MLKGIVKTSLQIFLLISCFSTISRAELPSTAQDSKPFNVYFFLATSCPISQQYTSEIKRLNQLYSKKGVNICLVFPSKNKKAVKNFMTTYGLNMAVKIDKRFNLVNELHATVTPEVFLLNEKKEILYHGAIDNWYYALGKNRLEITEHYFEDALIAAINNQPIIKPFFEPVGCFIESRKGSSKISH
jgi:thiol-disulfide isomerase/thioredoxin